MKLKNIKKASELTGGNIEFVIEDSSIAEVILYSDGQEVHIKASYGIRVYVRQDFEPVDRFVLTGTVRGLAVHEIFESESEAGTRQLALAGAQDLSEPILAVEKKTMMVNDNNDGYFVEASAPKTLQNVLGGYR